MIPDKIYTNNRGGYAKIPIFSQADANVEYIRKDALIEWLENKIVESEIAMDTADDPAIWGQRNAFKQVLDKLNSM